MKFLVVEDDIVSYTIVEKILSRFGRCLIATDGLAAVNSYIHNKRTHDGKPFFFL